MALCTLFATYLENRPMRLHDIARSAGRARKAYNRTIAVEAEALTHKAAKRAARRVKAQRRALLESLDAADHWRDYADA